MVTSRDGSSAWVHDLTLLMPAHPTILSEAGCSIKSNIALSAAFVGAASLV